MKPVLMIHEVKDEIFDLPLQDYILTFDDGLYTQYIHFNKIKELDTEKIFFISTDIVADVQVEQSSQFIECHKAHEWFFTTGDTKHYMNWSQIKEIHNTDRCTIGGHGHNHNRIGIKDIISDTRSMFNVFKEELNIAPSSFCFPYNHVEPAYQAYLQKRGIVEFYGGERIPIEDIL